MEINWINLAWRELSRRKTRALLSILGMGLCVTLLVSILTISRAVERAFQGPMSQAGADLVVQKPGPPCAWQPVKLAGSLSPVETRVLAGLRQDREVIAASGSLQLWAFPMDENGRPDQSRKPVVVTGIDLDDLRIGPVKPNKDKGACCEVFEGDLLSRDASKREALVTREFARIHRLKVGDAVRLWKHDFTVAGLIDPGKLARIAGAEVYVSLPQAQELYGHGLVMDTLYLKLRPEADPRRIESLLKKKLGADLAITTSSQLLTQAAGFEVLQKSVTQAFGLIVLAMVLLLVAKSSAAAVHERTREIGILKTVGWKDGEVRRLLLTEHFLQGLIAGIGGFLLGTAVSWVYAQTAVLKLPETLNKYPICADTIAPLAIAKVKLAFEPDLLLLGFALSVVISLAAAAVAAKKSSHLSPSEALRQL
jgi:putative ABC transport system permease protein